MNKNKKETTITITDSDIRRIARQVMQEISKQSHFQYYNCNPKGIVTGDCVIRAISKALNKHWDNVLKDLTKYSLKYKYFIGCTELYEIYLSDNGWEKHKAPRKKNGKPYKLIEWLNVFDNSAIVTIDKNHLTYIDNSTLYDVWDCTQHIVGEYWTYKR